MGPRLRVAAIVQRHDKVTAERAVEGDKASGVGASSGPPAEIR